MSTLLTGDLHLSINPRDEYRFAFLRRLIGIVEKHKPDRLIIAGDLTEEKDRHPAALVNKIVDHIHQLAEIAPVIVLEGNHDYKEEGHAFFEFIKRIPRVKWINRPTVIAKILLLPHTHDYEKDWQPLDWSMPDYPVIICHQTFVGAKVYGRKLDGGIPLSVLPDTSITFCGDIHEPQQFGNKLVYIGAPYHVDFGDDYKARMIWLDNDWHSMDTSNYPQKRLVYINDIVDWSRCNKGDIVKIQVELDDMGGWLEIKKATQHQAEKKGLRVWSISPKLRRKAIRRQHEVTDAGSDQDTLDAFGKRHGLSSATIKTGRNLL